MTTYILVLGNPVNGLYFSGPFATSAAAIAYAEDQGFDSWTLAPMLAPVEVQ